jgi:hypothetical protein
MTLILLALVTTFHDLYDEDRCLWCLSQALYLETHRFCFSASSQNPYPPFSRRDASEYQNFHFFLFSVFTQLSYMSIKGILAECECLYVYTAVVKMFLSHKSYSPAFP